MNTLIENWYLYLALVAVVIAVAIFVIKFYKKPTKEQIKQLKEWLLFAVIQAEKEIGSGNGVIKLRYVYDLFVRRFPWMTMLITFERFSSLVDEALDQMRELLDEEE